MNNAIPFGMDRSIIFIHISRFMGLRKCENETNYASNVLFRVNGSRANSNVRKSENSFITKVFVFRGSFNIPSVFLSFRKTSFYIRVDNRELLNGVSLANTIGLKIFFYKYGLMSFGIIQLSILWKYRYAPLLLISIRETSKWEFN